MITAARADLVTLVTGIAPKTHPAVPEEPAPPCVVVQPAEPFIQPDPDGQTFNEVGLVADFDVILLVQLDDEHDNSRATGQLDDMLDELLQRIAGQDAWTVENIAQPGGLLTTSWVHHGVRATVRTRIT